MNLEIQLKVEVKKTEGKGQGLFAINPIKAGEEVATAKGIVVPNSLVHLPPYEIIGDEICFQIDGSNHFCPISSDSKLWSSFWFANHSCDPNCGIKNRITLIALRDIAPLEEITLTTV